MMSADQAQTALHKLEYYLAMDPCNPELLARAIDTALAAGLTGQADAYARQALERFPNDAWFRHRQGNILMAQAKWQEAAVIFDDLLAGLAHIDEFDDQGTWPIRFNLAAARFRMGRNAEADHLLTPIVERHDADAGAVTLAVRVRHALRQPGRACELVKLHAERLENDVDFLNAACLACFDNEDLERARRWSEAALRLAPESAEALVVQGSLALAEADAERAGTLFRQARSLMPQDGRIWSGLGIASLLGHDLPHAEAQLEEAARRMPDHIGTWHALAWCQLFAGKVERAHDSFIKALALDPNFAESHGGMAVTLATTGRHVDAEACIWKALRLDRQCLSVQYAQALLNGETGDPVQFRSFARRALAGRRGLDGRPLSDKILGSGL
jgi:tetratricopeptide (TPR) repeat protein